MADPMRDSGLDLIREYIPDSPVYTPEDEPSQYDIPYVPASPVYPTPAYNPPTHEYIPSLITEVPELDLRTKRRKKINTSNSLTHQHHLSPVVCSAFHLQLTPCNQIPLDHHKVCLCQCI